MGTLEEFPTDKDITRNQLTKKKIERAKIQEEYKYYIQSFKKLANYLKKISIANDITNSGD